MAMGTSSSGGEIVIGMYFSRPHGARPAAKCAGRVADEPTPESGPPPGPPVPALLRGNMRSPSNIQGPTIRTARTFSHLVIVRTVAGASDAAATPLGGGGKGFCFFMLLSKAAASLARKPGPR